MACAPSEDSDQAGPPPSLVRVLCVLKAKDPSFFHADSEDSDLIGPLYFNKKVYDLPEFS